MSIDIELIAPECEHCGRESECVLDRNLTYNLSKMWHAAGIDWRAMLDMEPEDARDMLRVGLERLNEAPEKFRPMEPENGWGTYENLVNVCARVLSEWHKHPEARLSVT